MSSGASWHRTSCHVGQVSIGQNGIGPIDLGQIVLTPVCGEMIFIKKIQILEFFFLILFYFI